MFCGVRALEPHGVDDDIEADGHRQQRAGHDIDEQAEHDDGKDRPASPPNASASPGATRRPGSAARGALHTRIDVGVVPHVQRARGACAHRNAQHRDDAITGCSCTGRTGSRRPP